MKAAARGGGAAIFVGRLSEARRLKRLIDRKEPAVIAGPPGIGKSRLVVEVCLEAGRRLHVAPCLDLLRTEPLHPLAVLLGHSPDGDLDHAVELVTLRVGDGVLLVDDLQWADRHTLAALEPLTARLALVMTTRCTDDAHPVATGEIGAETIHLSALDPGETRQLLTSLTGPLPESAIESRCRRSGGNPLFITELAHSDTGASTLGDHLRLRLADLDPAATHLLALLAFAGRPLDRGTLAVDAGVVRDLLDRGLALDTGNSLAVAADVIAEAVESTTSPSLAVGLHRELAQQRAAAGDPLGTALHLMAAGDVGQAHEMALAAAEASDPAGPDHARALTIAAESAPPADAARLCMSAAWASINRSDTLAAQALLEDPDVFAGSEVHPGERLLALALVAYSRDDVIEATALVDEAFDLVDERDGGLLSRVLSLRAALRAALFDPRAVADATQAMSLAEEHGAPTAGALAVLGGAHGLTGSDEWRWMLPAAIERARSEGLVAIELQAANVLVMVAHLSLEYDLATNAAEAAISRARQLGQRQAEQTIRLSEATNKLFLDASSRECLAELGTVLADPVSRTNRLGATTLLWLGRADLGGTDDAIVALEDLCRRTTDARSLGAIDWVLAEVHHLRNAHAETERHALAACAPEMWGSPGYDSAAVLVEWARLEQGLPAVAPRPSGLMPTFAGLQSEFDAIAQIRVFRETGHTSASAEAVALLDQAAAHHDRYLRRCAWRCRCAAGSLLAEANEPEEARRRLLELDTDVAAAGHQALLGRVRRALRLLGVQRAPRTTAGHGGLTTTQRRVLELVATGRSSTEIAVELQLSVATVDTHIRNAMRRSGTRTRIEAARAALTDSRAARDGGAVDGTAS